MAKLSLWLVSMDPERPFTFLDDRLVAGDSLLGVTSLEQIEYLCLDPKQARAWWAGTPPWADVQRGRDLRYTIGPRAQREILDRLLELNHERYAEEVAKGLHAKKKARTARAPKKSDAEGLF